MRKLLIFTGALLLWLAAACGREKTMPPLASPSAPAPTSSVQVPTPTRAALPPETAQAVAAIANQAVREAPLPGLALAIRLGDNPIYAQSFGYTGLARSVPVTSQTIYPILSITKEFTAAAILQLVEQGAIKLDDPVSRYIPEMPQAGSGILVRHLLNHSSGLPDPGSLALKLDPERKYPERDLINLYLSSFNQLDFQPGSQGRYSNEGYLLLGLLLERVSGQAYADYLETHIFTPLGLENTSYCGNPLEIQGYRHLESELKPVQVDLSHAYSAGGLCSTASDLVRWQHALLVEGKVVGAESLQEMTGMTSDLSLGEERLTYGLGLMMSERRGGPAIFHSGWVDGFHSLVVYYPEHDLTLALLTNAGPYDLEDLEEEITARLLAASK